MNKKLNPQFAGAKPVKILMLVLGITMVILMIPFKSLAQAPQLSYSPNHVYSINTPITALLPTNTGGAVPTNVYSKVTGFVPASAGFGFGTTLTIDAQGNVYATGNPTNTVNGGIIYKITPTGEITQFASSSTGLLGAGFITADGQGNIYMIGINYVIQKITPAGVVSNLSSNPQGYVDGPLSIAQFNTPAGLAADAQGNLYVTDAGNQRIRKITPAGVVSTLAGSGTAGFANGPGTFASFNYPGPIVCDGAGNIYVSDAYNPVIRKITPSGLVSTFAGNGSFGAINGPALMANFEPSAGGFAADVAGNVYISDTNNDVIREAGADGFVTTFAGNKSYTQTDGVGTTAGLGWPFSIALDKQGHLYVADWAGGQTVSIRKIETTGYAIFPALPAGLVFDATTGKISGTPTAISPATSYTITGYNLYGKSSVTLSIKVTNGNPSSNANLSNLTISSGTLSPAFTAGTTNYAASVTSATTSINIVPTAADAGATISVNGKAVLSGSASNNISLSSGPNSITTIISAPDGATTNTYTVTISRVTPPPTISYSGPKIFTAGKSIGSIVPVSSNVNVPVYNSSPVTLASGFSFPRGVAVDKDGNVYVAGNNDGAVKKIPAGGGTPVILGLFDHPTGVAVDLSGNVYVAAPGNTTIKKIPAGGGNPLDVGLGFTAPYGVAVDASGNIYVADSVKRTVQKIPADGSATVMVGTVYAAATGVAVDPTGNVYAADYISNAIFEFPANGGKPKITGAGFVLTLDAGFNLPFGIAADAAGNVYVADSNNNTIKEILAGSGTIVNIGTGLNNPASVAVDGIGNIYVADENNGAIKEIKPSGGYCISPFLPVGLYFNNSTGIISGTPTIASPATDYTITAYNSFGSGIGIINIKVNLPPVPVISYSGPNSYTINAPINPLVPAANGTAVNSYGKVTTWASGFGDPSGIATDALGNVYIPDIFTHTVKKFPPGGGAPVIIGTGFSGPSDVAIDSAGNVYVADIFSNQVKKIQAADGATVLIASGFNYPQGIAIDAAGNLYIADRNNNLVKKIAANGGAITTLGTGINGPLSVAVDRSGNVYVSTYDNTIKKILANGVVTLITDTGLNYPSNIKLDVSGNLYIANSNNGEIREIIAGSKTSVILVNGLDYPQGVAVDPAGNLYFCDGVTRLVEKYKPVGGYFIDRALPAGLSFDTNTGTIGGTPTLLSPAINYTVTAYNAGGSGQAVVNIAVLSLPVISYTSPPSYGLGIAITPLSPVSSGGLIAPVAYNTSTSTIGSGFSQPNGVAVDAAGNVYVADYLNNAVKKIPVGGGTPVVIGSGFSHPRNVAVDVAGNVFVADGGNNSIKEIPVGGGAVITLGSGFSQPNGVAVDAAGNVYVGDYGNNAVKKIPAGNATPVVIGSGFNHPRSVAVDAKGNVFVADGGNTAVKKIPVGGGIPVTIGSGFALTTGVAIDASGNVYVGDYGNNAIKMIPVGGVAPVSIGSGFASPFGVAVDGAGKVYVGDLGNNAVKTIKPTGGYYINTSLPTGLTFANATGMISGTPTVSSPVINYTITAYNAAGGGQATVNIAVLSPPVISFTGPQTYTAGIAITPLSPANTGGPIGPVAYNTSTTTIGSGLSQPNGVAVDAAGNVYVADYLNNAVKKIPAGNGTPVVIGSGFSHPRNVAVDAAGNVFVADGGNNAIKEIPVGGGAVVTLGSGFNQPNGVAVDAAGNVYVGDYGNSLVKKIPAGNGTPVIIGSGFSSPRSVAVDAAGNVYVADGGHTAVKKIPAGGGAPVTIGSGFGLTTGVAVDAPGNVYVGDYGNNAVKMIPVGGGAPVSIGSGFASPFGVAVDGTGKVYVGDLAHNAVKVIKPTGGYYINTALPAGLTFANATGFVNGTPTISSPATNYTVTGYNAAGSGQANVNIKVTGNPNLAGLTINSGSISPVFAAGTISYKDTVINTVASVIVTPTAVFVNSTIKVNGSTVTSGTASAGIPLVVGDNTITTVVTAQDGVTTKTYTLTVRRLTPGGLNNLYLPGSGEQTAMVSNLNEKVEANNILSPNGDGINDIWVVKNIAFYPNNTVTVYNRAGEVIFTKKGYANDWDGTYRGSVLSEGTYYYLVELGNGSKIKGFISVLEH